MNLITILLHIERLFKSKTGGGADYAGKFTKFISISIDLTSLDMETQSLFSKVKKPIHVNQYKMLLLSDNFSCLQHGCDPQCHSPDCHTFSFFICTHALCEKFGQVNESFY